VVTNTGCTTVLRYTGFPFSSPIWPNSKPESFVYVCSKKEVDCCGFLNLDCFTTMFSDDMIVFWLSETVVMTWLPLFTMDVLTVLVSVLGSKAFFICVLFREKPEASSLSVSGLAFKSLIVSGMITSCSVIGVVTWLVPFESVTNGLLNSMDIESEGPVMEMAESVSGDVAMGLIGGCWLSEAFLVRWYFLLSGCRFVSSLTFSAAAFWNFWATM